MKENKLFSLYRSQKRNTIYMLSRLTYFVISSMKMSSFYRNCCTLLYFPSLLFAPSQFTTFALTTNIIFYNKDMAQRREYVDASGLRQDGRRREEARSIKIECGVVDGIALADGCCMLTWGLTKVKASVYGPKPVPRQDARSHEGVMNCEITMASFSKENRRVPRRGAECGEIAADILCALETVVDLTKFPNSQIDIRVEVLQSDGNEREAAMNAVSLALADANIPLYDLVVAVKAGLVGDDVLVDLSNAELAAATQTLHVVALAHNVERIAFLSNTKCLTEESLERLYRACEGSCAQIAASVTNQLRKHVESTLVRKN